MFSSDHSAFKRAVDRRCVSRDQDGEPLLLERVVHTLPMDAEDPFWAGGVHELQYDAGPSASYVPVSDSAIEIIAELPPASAAALADPPRASMAPAISTVTAVPAMPLAPVGRTEAASGAQPLEVSLDDADQRWFAEGKIVAATLDPVRTFGRPWRICRGIVIALLGMSLGLAAFITAGSLAALYTHNALWMLAAGASAFALPLWAMLWARKRFWQPNYLGLVAVLNLALLLGFAAIRPETMQTALRENGSWWAAGLARASGQPSDPLVARADEAIKGLARQLLADRQDAL